MKKKPERSVCRNIKVLIDTNIILDVLCKRPDFYEDSAKVFKLCEVRRISGVIASLTVPNIIYIPRKELDAEKNRKTPYRAPAQQG